MTHVIGTRVREDAAGITHDSVQDCVRSSYPVAKRCRHCNELVKTGTVHATAVVQFERDDDERTACYSVFCDSGCMDKWVRSVTE